MGTNSMEQETSWETNSFTSGQDILYIFMRVHKIEKSDKSHRNNQQDATV